MYDNNYLYISDVCRVFGESTKSTMCVRSSTKEEVITNLDLYGVYTYGVHTQYGVHT